MRDNRYIPSRALLLIVGIFYLLSTACGVDSNRTNTETDHQHYFERRMTGIGFIAVNGNAPKHTGNITLELDLEIGADDGPEEYIFRSVGRINVDARGRIYVNSVPMRVFDATGQYLRDIGRAGSGPGEMRFVARQHVWPDGMIDLVGIDSRWVRRNADGELIFDRRVYDFAASVNTRRLVTHQGETSFIYRSPWEHVPVDTSTAWWIHRCDSTMSPVEVVLSFSRGRPTRIQSEFEGRLTGTTLPFSPGLLIATSATGQFVLADCDSTILYLYTDSFEQAGTIRWESDRAELTQDDIRAAHENLYSRYRGGPEPDEQARALRYLLAHDFPAVKPAIMGITAAVDGRLWVECWGQGTWDGVAEPDNKYDYWVFTPEGELEYEVTVPFRIKTASATHLYEAINDGEHTPQVRRYRWKPPEG